MLSDEERDEIARTRTTNTSGLPLDAPDEFAFVWCSDGNWRPAFLRFDVEGNPHHWEFANGGMRRFDDAQAAPGLAAVERIRDDAVAEVRAGYQPEALAAIWAQGKAEGITEAQAAERALVERVRAACDELERPFAGARQRANTNEDFAEIAAEEKARKNAAARVRAALRPEAATTERRWDECLHGVTLGSVCLDCPSKWASIPARPAATTEGAARPKVCWRSECRYGCYYGPDACSVTAAAVHPGTEGAVEQEGAHFACCDLPDGGCGGCGNCPEHCVCDRPCGYCIAARAARGEGEPT